MNDARQDLIHIQELVGTAFSATGSLVALTDGGQMNPNKLQKTLEQTMDYFERSTLELRQLCERYASGVGGFMHKPVLPAMEVTGSVETFGYDWLHITLNTLLPHCRYQTPNWLSDTIRRLLDGYEACGKRLPFYSRALLVIDEHTGIEGRHIFDQDTRPALKPLQRKGLQLRMCVSTTFPTLNAVPNIFKRPCFAHHQTAKFDGAFIHFSMNVCKLCDSSSLTLSLKTTPHLRERKIR